MDPYDLPEQLSVLQSYDMSKIGFIQDLIRGIKKVIKTDEPKQVVRETVVVGGSANAAPLLRRAFMFLEDGDWDKADDFCEQVLNIEPENAQAYLGKLMAELHVSKKEKLADCEQPFDGLNNYRKAIRFGGEKLATELSGYVSHIKDRNEYNRQNAIYEKAIALLGSKALILVDDDDEVEYALVGKDKAHIYGQVIDLLNSIPGFKDADDLTKQCQERKEEQRKVAEQKAEEHRRQAAERRRAAEQKEEEHRKIAEQKAEEEKRKVSAVARALSEENKTKGGPTLEERLSAENAMVEKLEIVLSVFDSTKAKVISLQKEYDELLLNEKQLSEQRSRLGAFAKKEKKLIDEEHEANRVKYSKIIAELDQLKKVLGKYTAASDVERDLNNARKNAADLSALIGNECVKADNKFSFNEAFSIYLKEPDVTRAINAALYPTITPDSIMFGRYVQKNYGSPEPIEWLVLEKEYNKVLLISKYALDGQKFNSKLKDVIWETCSLREWLNEIFLNTAFSENERAMIPSVTLSSDKNPLQFTNPETRMTDQVFILSINECFKNSVIIENRQCQGTEYCYAQNVTKRDNGNCWWWLRSPGQSYKTAACVDKSGVVQENGVFVNVSSLAVRPALWIELR